MTTLALVLWLALFSTATAACQTEPRLELEVDWTRTRELGLGGSKDAGEERAALRDLVAWRLAVVGVPARVELVGERVQLVLPESSEQDQRAAVTFLESLGLLEFQVMAEDADLGGALAEETTRFQAWRAEHSDALLSRYNSDPARPEPRIAWYTTRFDEQNGPPRAVRLAESTAESFGARDLARTFATLDALGYPALGFELVAEREEAFHAFTAANVDLRLAIVLHGEIRSAPTLNSALAGSGILEGRFKDEEVRALIERLAARGPLRVVEFRPERR